MELLLLTLLSLLITSATFSRAEETRTVTVLEIPTFTTTLGRVHPVSTPSTFATHSRTFAATSVVQATRTEPGFTSAPSASGAYSDGSGGSDSSSFGLSTGGLIALVVVVVLVAVFGGKYSRLHDAVVLE